MTDAHDGRATVVVDELTGDRRQVLEMRQQVRRAEQVAPAHPYPDAPDAELFHELAGRSS